MLRPIYLGHKSLDASFDLHWQIAEIVRMFPEWHYVNDGWLGEREEKDGMMFEQVAEGMIGYNEWQLEGIWARLIERRRQRGVG
jgi:hypothetical protein